MQLSGSFQATVRQLPISCQAVVRKLSGRQSSGSCQAVVMQLSGIFQAIVRKLLGSFQAGSRHAIVRRSSSNSCELISHKVPIF